MLTPLQAAVWQDVGVNNAARMIDLGAGAIPAAGLAIWLADPRQGSWWPALAALAVYSLVVAVVSTSLASTRQGSAAWGWANRITLSRAAMACALAGMLVEPSLFVEHAWPVIALTGLSLALDGLDGWVARRLQETSEFGARFDMETDAALIVVLCCALWLSGLAPAWVLAIGLMRPLFVLAGLALPWLSRPLPERFRRKLVCVFQVGVLPVALLPFLPAALRLTFLAGALLALAVSFAIDIAWLYRHRQARSHPQWRTP
jgi:phosphatidylglycerophosphate synthase